jgi:hypothetical protein
VAAAGGGRLWQHAGLNPEESMRPTLPLLRAAVVAAALAAIAPTAVAASLPTPKEFLRLDVGADRVLADYRQIRAYFAELDRLSPRVQVQTLGKSTLGEDMVMAVVTSEANQARLPRLKEIAKQLADPRGRTDAEIAALAEEGRAFLLITCNIHATEIASTQMAMEWAHALAAAEDAETKRRLDEVVLLLRADTIEEARLAVERVLRVVAQPYQIETGQDPVHVTASMGATIYPIDRSDADTLLRHADHAMYQAKGAGKGRFHLFGPTDSEPAES